MLLRIQLLPRNQLQPKRFVWVEFLLLSQRLIQVELEQLLINGLAIPPIQLLEEH